LLKRIADLGQSEFDLEIMNDLTHLPHFRTELTENNVHKPVEELRNKISKATGIIICNPEYVFSIPSGLKNLIEWCMSTVVFSDKPVGLITASTQGEKGHTELQLLMKTIQATFTDNTTLHIQGIKGKVNKEGQITDSKTESDIQQFVNVFNMLVKSSLIGD
jgi:chromate reductase